DIGNVDFGDLILLPIRLLRGHPEIKNRIQQRFLAVLVDEYQDTNVAQYQLLRELVGPKTWLGVVGDDDQSIYRFRGAEVGNILGFPDMFPGTQVVKLEQNYRSTATILEIASAVVSNNTGRLGKTLWTAGETGNKAVMAYLEDHNDEAEWCAERIDAAAAEKSAENPDGSSDGKYSGTAILYRTNAQSRVFETLFRKRNIPYRIVGTLSFYQREEVKDVLAYLSWLANHRDEVAFRRIANKPARGLGKTGLNRLMDAALTNHSGDILEACRKYPAKGKAAKALRFLSELSERYTDSESFEHLGFLIQDLADASGLLEHYREVDRVENSQRTRNLDELVNAASEYPSTPEGLTAFLELVELDQALLEEEEEDDNRVTLITMHNTKGLEFDSVIITGMEEGLFPRGDEGFDDDELEEERRLFYVAITRARKELAFTTCRRRMLWGRYRDTVPSRFLQEVPDETIRVEGAGDSRESAYDPWRPGVKLMHDEYGVGVVQKRMANGGHTVIHVLFESGRSATLLPEFSSNHLELLGTAGDDW
ncbi:MAG: DNA helicase UvrD, partial [Spirochaetes bacterium]